MADGRESLVDFVTWAMDAYPADKYALISPDHGMGWPGGWKRPHRLRFAYQAKRNPFKERLGDQLFLDELRGALSRDL